MSATKMFATPNRIAYQLSIAHGGIETILQSTIIADLPQGALRSFLSKFLPSDNGDWQNILSQPELRFSVKAIDTGVPGCFYSVAPDTTTPNALDIGAAGTSDGTGMLEIEYLHTLIR